MISDAEMIFLFDTVKKRFLFPIAQQNSENIQWKLLSFSPNCDAARVGSESKNSKITFCTNKFEQKSGNRQIFR
jgi:hypothetical protein